MESGPGRPTVVRDDPQRAGPAVGCGAAENVGQARFSYSQSAELPLGPGHLHRWISAAHARLRHGTFRASGNQANAGTFADGTGVDGLRAGPARGRFAAVDRG